MTRSGTIPFAVWETEYPDEGSVLFFAYSDSGARRKWRKATRTKGPSERATAAVRSGAHYGAGAGPMEIGTMTSASTKRRHKRNVELVAAWKHPIGTRVVVERANGETLETVTESEAFLLDGVHAMIRVRGIPGNTRLSRVTRLLDVERKPSVTKRKADAFIPWDARAARAENEIQRLRAAMAHAMIDCQWIVTLPNARADVRRRAHRALTDLKTALEKK